MLNQREERSQATAAEPATAEADAVLLTDGVRPEGSPARGMPMRMLRAQGTRSVGWNVVSIAVFLVLWHVVAALAGSAFLPGPIDTARAFIQLQTDGDVTGHTIIGHAIASTERVLLGFLLGALVGAPLGLIMGLYPKLWGATRGVLEPLRFIPPIAWIPIAIVLMTGMTRFAFLIFLGAFFPVLIGTLTAIARVENLHLDVAKVFGASKFWAIRHVVIPSVLPEVMASMRIGLGIGWMTIVAAEMAGGTQAGLGKFMINYAELLRIPEIIVGMIIIGALGFALNELLLFSEKRMFKWRWKVTI